MTLVPDSLDRVRVALDALAAALLTGTSDDVLAVEATLADAVVAWQRDARPHAADAGDLRPRLADLRRRVIRCQRLGGGIIDLALAAPATATYGRGGRAGTARVAEAASTGDAR